MVPGNPSSKSFNIPCLKQFETYRNSKSMKIQQQIILYIVIVPMRIAILIHIGGSWCIVNPEIGSHDQATSQPGAFPRCRNNLRMPSLARPPDSGREAETPKYRNAEIQRFQDVIEMMCPPSFSGFQLVYLFYPILGLL